MDARLQCDPATLAIEQAHMRVTSNADAATLRLVGRTVTEQ
jgi:hypothetical protein